MRYAGISEQESDNAIDSQRLTKTRREQHERANDPGRKSTAVAASVLKKRGQLLTMSGWPLGFIRAGHEMYNSWTISSQTNLKIYDPFTIFFIPYGTVEN